MQKQLFVFTCFCVLIIVTVYSSSLRDPSEVNSFLPGQKVKLKEFCFKTRNISFEFSTNDYP
jgi:hypothetical protein